MGVLYARTGPSTWEPISTTSGGGGSVTDVVWVGPSAPVDPATELWWDTDEPTPPLTGIVAYAERMTDRTNITTVVDLLTVSHTAVAGRRYKITGHTWPYVSVAPTNAYATLTDAANVVYTGSQVQIPAVSLATTLPLLFVTDGTHTGSTTWKLRMVRNGGTGVITALAPTFFFVEDIGVF